MSHGGRVGVGPALRRTSHVGDGSGLGLGLGLLVGPTDGLGWTGVLWVGEGWGLAVGVGPTRPLSGDVVETAGADGVAPAGLSPGVAVGVAS